MFASLDRWIRLNEMWGRVVRRHPDEVGLQIGSGRGSDI